MLYIAVAFVLFVLAVENVIVPEFSEVSVPTDVMFGCAFVVTTAARGTVPVTFAPVRAERPDAGPVKLVAVSPARLVAPDTAREVRVPCDVIAGCAAAETVRALVESGTVPVTFAPVSNESPVPTPTKDPEVVAPVTPRDVRVPTDVIAGWAAFVTVPEDTARETVPVTFAPVRAESPVPTPTNEPEVVAPVTPRETKVPTDVMFGCALPVTAVAVAEVETVPTMFAARIPESPAPPPKNEVELVIPPTVNPVSVPTEVMAGCAAVVTVPAVDALVADGTVPVTFAPVSDESPDPTPKKDPLVVAPDTPRDVSVPSELILGCAEDVTVPALDATDTVPVTLAPARLERPPPSPVKSVPTRGPDRVPPVKGRKLNAGEPVKVP